MTKLQRLRRTLRAWARRRRWFRWSVGYSGWLTALIWVALGLWLVDWLFGLGRTERGVALGVAALVAAWAFLRWTRPWLGQRESELDMALAVQRLHGIDTDLVAALQFESPEAPRWGSVELEQAVIDQVATISQHRDLQPTFSLRPWGRRLVGLALSGLVVAAGVVQYPHHAAVFLNRLLLGSMHYPTLTQIQRLRINGRDVELEGLRPATARSAYGQPVRFEVVCSGVLPGAGRLELRALLAGVTARLPLQTASEPRLYQAQLPRLLDSVRYQVYVGDAWTEPALLEIVPLAVVEVELEVRPPQYVGAATPQKYVGLRQLAVIEGSQVVLRVHSDKPLQTATVFLEGQALPMQRQAHARPATPRGADQPVAAETWVLPPARTPLEAVEAPIRYGIQVLDRDGLELEDRVEGMIRVQADQAPRVAASAVTRDVLPSARPSIAYSASDDFGLARVLLGPELRRGSGSVETPAPLVAFDRGQGQPPPRQVQSRAKLDLAPWQLAKGDQVQITVVAQDFRGAERPGKSTASEPILFHVTDEQGILATMAETDRESARQLETIIQRQLDVGGSP